MAKKAASTPSKSKTNGAAKSNGAPKPAAKAPAAKPVAAKSSAEAPLSHDLIGETAGKVWQALSENGGLTLADLKKSVNQSTEVVIAALGWLAREDKVDFDAAGKSTKVSLK